MEFVHSGLSLTGDDRNGNETFRMTHASSPSLGFLPAMSAENSRAILAIIRTSARSEIFEATSRRKTMNFGCPFGSDVRLGSFSAAETATRMSGGRPGNSCSSIRESLRSYRHHNSWLQRTWSHWRRRWCRIVGYVCRRGLLLESPGPFVFRHIMNQKSQPLALMNRYRSSNENSTQGRHSLDMRPWKMGCLQGAIARSWINFQMRSRPNLGDQFRRRGYARCRRRNIGVADFRR